MDHIITLNVRDTVIDIDHSCNETSHEEVGISPNDDHISRDSVSLVINQENIDDKSEKRKPIMSAKKPPRPKRGILLPLDAADERLIKELAELAMIKRARRERIKAIKKMKAAKASNNSSSSSSGSFMAMVFTLVFCILMISQGCHSWRISPGNKSAVLVPGSQMQQNNSNSNVTLLINNVESPNVMEMIDGVDSKDEARKTIRRN